jgi:hypothetical protein
MAIRWLLLLSLALACLAAPSAAGGVTANAVVQGTLGSNGWYVSNVSVSWQFDPTPTTVSGCFVGTITAEGHTHIACTASWGGPSINYPLDIYIDKTPPKVHGVPSRTPDANGWYDKPVSFTFAGTDETSGVAACSSTSYSGPANGNASVAGTCRDNAGNTGRGAYGFSYDATPPTVGAVTAKHGNRSVSLKWTASADTQVCQITRAAGASAPAKVVYRGTGKAYRDKGLRVGTQYRYTVTAFDRAANAAKSTLAVTATGRLINPVPGQRVTSPMHLTWLPVKGASYYNVQLIRDKRILSAWPKRTSLKLQRSWVYHGHRYRLRPGVYRWYVWPGFKKRALADYGRLLGSSSFIYGG